jgi:methanogenic corrinoid protein MtbC1
VSTSQPSDFQTESPFALARTALLAAVVGLDPAAIERAIRQSLGAGVGWRVYADVFVPVLEEVGRRWAEGHLTVSHERLASEAVGVALRDLLRRVHCPPGAPKLVLACVDAEQHVLPLHGAALLAAHAGWRAVVLGARTPPDALGQAIARLHPSAVALSATVPCAASLFDACAAVMAHRPWLVGGPAALAHRAHLEGLGAQVAANALDLPPFLDQIARPFRSR